MAEQNIKLNIDEKSNVKTLIYELFSGVGFCNQLFSLETAIYLANISNRKLILLIRNPLCHCGHASWNYGYILEYFSNNYKAYLPYGIELYYRNPPNNILEKINVSEKFKISGKHFSSCVFVEKELYTEENKIDITKFANGRNIDIIDYNSWNKYEYFYISQSNASRCFYNFYTTKERYILMNKICNSLNILKQEFYDIINTIKLPNNFNSIHFRFGDKSWESTRIKFLRQKTINNDSNVWNEITNHISSIFTQKLPIIVMTDNKSHHFFSILKNQYEILFADDLVDNDLVNKYFSKYKLPVVYFILEKIISEKANKFIGSEESTVSNHINYNNFLNNKSHNYYIDRIIDQGKYTWTVNNYNGPNIAWRVFFPENIFLVSKNHFFSYIKYINIQPISNKKIISFCLYDIEKKRYDPNRIRRDFYKGIYVNYEAAKTIYPGWIIRIYMPYTEPSKYIKILETFKDIEVILVDTNICLRTLRFLPYDDIDVDVWISRDLDSMVNWREKAAVDDWLTNYSDKELHCMQDSNGHCWSTLGGMIGVQNKFRNSSFLNFMIDYCDKNTEVTFKYAFDCKVAEIFFLKENNYIQHYRAGTKLENNIPFPKHKQCDNWLVGNIIDIDKYFYHLKLEELYPILKPDNKSLLIKQSEKYNYYPWKATCFLLWNEDDFIMTVDPYKKDGNKTFCTLNGDGKKIMEIGTKIQVLWESKNMKEAYKLDENTIVVIHDGKPYYFNKVI